jgi:hypothetical protein
MLSGGSKGSMRAIPNWCTSSTLHTDDQLYDSAHAKGRPTGPPPSGMGEWSSTYHRPGRDVDNHAGPDPLKVTVMSLSPRRLRVVAAAATAALAPLAVVATETATAAPAGAATTTTAPTQSAESLYNAAIKAATRLGVHFQSLATQSGTTLAVTGDTGTNAGAQNVTVSKGNVVEHVSAMVIGTTGYIQGNASALRNVIGLDSAKANKYAGKWLSFPTSNQGLDTLVAGLKDSDVAAELQMSGPYTYGTARTVAGERALAIKGTVTDQSGTKIPVTLYVPASGTALPVEQVTNPASSKGSSNIHSAVTFTRWGEKVTQTAPAHSSSLLKLAPTSVSGSSSSG